MSPFDLMGFAGNLLDRLSEKRDDAAALADLQKNFGARAVILAGAMPVLRHNGAGLSALHALKTTQELSGEAPIILLGQDETGPIYGVALPETFVETDDPAQNGFLDPCQPKIAGRPDLQLRDLRALALEGALPHAEIAMLAQAKAVLHWHATHRFCPRCGAKTETAQAGWRRDCPNCGAQNFPRTDPVVIVLALHGDACLMGRQKNFPSGMYSCLAGFVECGETLEEAARREIFEEAGVRLGAV